MEMLLPYVTGFGLASSAGGKACIPVLLLGIFHYTPYFKLSPQFAWIASPPVLATLAVLVIVELILDAHPDLGEHMDFLSYLPATAGGFIAMAAATGNVDRNLIELGASGILGGATGGATHYLRNMLRGPIRESAEDLHEHVGKAVTLGEAATTTAVGVTAFVAPAFVAVALIAVAVCGWLIVRKINSRRVACVHCGQPIRPGARVCRHCKQEQQSPPVPVD